MQVSPEQLSKRMLKFYAQHGRKDLPWQQNPTAYRVWVSEIMLQQTQVKTVIPYYQKFMRSFPTLQDLASATIDQVLQHWQGLGYYSRARNLHRCAQTIMAEHGGNFPQELQAMQQLPGIGRSTAGAILSLAMKQPTAILDGNVKRVLSRVFLVEGWSGKSQVQSQLWALAEKYTPKKSTAEFNQSMMDLGASLCSRSQPKCEQCPLADICMAFIQHKTHEFPHKKPAKVIPTKNVTMRLSVKDNQIQLIKRPPVGIWGGLWSLPEIESLDAPRVINEFRHTFTHFHWQIKIVEGQSRLQIQENSLAAWHNIQQLQQVALPAPIKKFLFAYFNLS